MRVERECVIKLKVWYSHQGDEDGIEDVASQCGLEFGSSGTTLVNGSHARFMSFETGSNEDADRFEAKLKVIWG